MITKSSCLICNHQMDFDLSKYESVKRNPTMKCPNCNMLNHFNIRDEKLNIVGANYRFKINGVLWNFWYHRLGNWTRYTKMTKLDKEQLLFEGLLTIDKFDRMLNLKAFW